MSEKEVMSDSKKIIITKDEIHEFKEAFDIFDKNNTGLISTKDIIKIKKIFSYPITGETIEKMIKEIDTSGNGKFDFQKFITLMQKQIEFIEEKDESIVLESLKDEYLGNKRKRETLNNNDNSKSDYDLQLINNTNSLNEENSDSNEEVYIDNEDIENDDIENNSINGNINSNNEVNEKNKLGNHIIRFMLDDGSIDNLNAQINIDLTGEDNKIEKYDYIDINKRENSRESLIDNKNEGKEKKHKKKFKKFRKLKKIKNINKDFSKNNIVYINKKELSKDLVDLIEGKNVNNNTFTPIKTKNNEQQNLFNDNFILLPTKEVLSEQISIKESNLYFHKQKSNYSSKFISDFNLNNMSMSNITSGENSFASEYSSDFLRKPTFYPSYGINARFDRPPMISIKKRKKDFISNSSKKFLDRIKERLDNKGIDANDKKSLDKSTFSKNQLANLQKIVNKNFYGSEYIIQEQSRIFLNDNTILHSNDKSKNESKFINDKSEIKIMEENIDNKIENIIKIEEKEEDKKKENIPQIEEKPNINIQILSNFECLYKKNHNNDIIIKKAIEIPYLIIIDKKYLNKEEIEKVSHKKKSKNKINVKNDSKKNNIKEKKKTSNIKYVKQKKKINNPKNVNLIRDKPIIIETLSDTE